MKINHLCNIDEYAHVAHTPQFTTSISKNGTNRSDRIAKLCVSVTRCAVIKTGREI